MPVCIRPRSERATGDVTSVTPAPTCGFLGHTSGLQGNEARGGRCGMPALPAQPSEHSPAWRRRRRKCWAYHCHMCVRWHSPTLSLLYDRPVSLEMCNYSALTGRLLSTRHQWALSPNTGGPGHQGELVEAGSRPRNGQALSGRTGPTGAMNR